MALVLDVRVRETSTTTGTGTYTLLGAVVGFQAFSVIGNTNTTWYIADNGTDWEEGIGTYTLAGTTLARTTILASSNADAAVNWGAGTKTIRCTLPASKAYVGPATLVDNQVPRSDGTDGRTFQAAPLIIGDNGDFTLSGNGTGPGVFFKRAGATATATSITASKTRHATDPTAFTVVNSGDTIVQITGEGADGDQFLAAASIRILVDTTPGDNDMPGRISLLTTPDGAAAVVERLRIDSGHNIFAYKDDGANPGQVRAEHWLKLTSTNTLASSTTTQPLFDGGGGPAGGALTLDTGQHFFDCMFQISAMSATSGNGEFEPLGAGTATMTEVLYQVTGFDNADVTGSASITGSFGTSPTANSINMVNAGTGVALAVSIRGTFNITVAGTIIPSIDLVTAAAATVLTGSYFRCWRAGDTGVNSVGAWS